MSEIIIVGYPKCTTCKRAEKFLSERGYEYSYRNIKEDKPSAEELRHWHKTSGLALKSFFNTSGILYREHKIKDKLADMSEEEQYALLASDGMLVKRPILLYRDKVLAGFKEERWLELLS